MRSQLPCMDQCFKVYFAASRQEKLLIHWNNVAMWLNSSLFYRYYLLPESTDFYAEYVFFLRRMRSCSIGGTQKDLCIAEKFILQLYYSFGVSICFAITYSLNAFKSNINTISPFHSLAHFVSQDYNLASHTNHVVCVSFIYKWRRTYFCKPTANERFVRNFLYFSRRVPFCRISFRSKYVCSGI